MHRDLHYKNIMNAYAKGRKTYMGFDLGTQSSGTMTQQEAYKHDYAKRIAERCEVMTTQNTEEALLEAAPSELAERIKSQKINGDPNDEYRSIFKRMITFCPWDETEEGFTFWKETMSRMLADLELDLDQAHELTDFSNEEVTRITLEIGAALIEEEEAAANVA